MNRVEITGISSKLRNLIYEHSAEADIPAGTEVMYEGQYIKSIPILTKGLIKVFSRYEDKELLLYYIKPFESCIMTFDASLNQSPSRVYASTEEDSSVLLMPVEKVFKWMKEYPEMNQLFFRQYNVRYTELIEMINQILFDKMDKRLYEYLKSKAELKNQNPIKISHREIANDLGTAREVVTRVLKKLEMEQLVSQEAGAIKVM
ncbi:Crp/Fnr family transcriptional regulator [Maribellus sp. CM-23]|uniref:Crp/Fnr family transcriptional regulator n=1 Tax=Maribellus sp. CM-23 TaxID=2781026 RepID=UPI001F2999B7|nr:Crp/Fnr family transcriptional regulator [Maribellus sp. CM-23]MCE4564019.1 Crp/Fnr family transcriptional regulator [Maribellus sp. CM-23]